jgi:TetR/AcrR family transcriptional repressor of nem operon
MARPIEFDRPKALNRALALFWRQGFQATSLADLLAAMGISRGSFYAAFGDKRRLFIECLDLFASHMTGRLRRARTQAPPLVALQGFLEHSLLPAGDPRGRWGCLLVNTVLELAGVDDGLSGHASRHLEDMQAAFQAALLDAGATPGQAVELAAMLTLVSEGVLVSSRRPLSDPDQLQPIATTFRLIRSALG